MKSRAVVWTALLFFLILGLSADMLFTHLYHSRSHERMERCFAVVKEGGRDSGVCSEAALAADSSFSTLSSINQITLFAAFFSLIVVTARLFANEKRIDDLERRINRH